MNSNVPGLSGDLSAIGSVGAATDTGGSVSVFVGDTSWTVGSTGAGSSEAASVEASSVGAAALGGEFVQKLGTNSIAFTFNVENVVERSELPSCAILFWYFKN